MQATKLATASLLLAAIILPPIGAAIAQEAGGTNAFLTIGQRFRSITESGPDQNGDDGTSTVTTLSFGVSSETRSQRLALTANTGLAYYFDGTRADTEDNPDFEDPSVRLAYSKENRAAILSLISTYRERDVGDGFFFDEELDQNVATGSGTRTILTFAPSLVLGRGGPVTTTLRYRFVSDEFSGADPRENDATTQSFQGRMAFRLSPVMNAFVFARYNERDIEDGNDRITSSIGVGANYTINPVTRVTASVEYDDNETKNDDGETINSNDGIGFSVGLTNQRVTGAYRLNTSVNETINGTRFNLRGGRSFQIRDGNFDLSLGVSQSEGESLSPVVNVSYTQFINTASRISLNFNQAADINDDDNDVIRTRASVRYSYQINSLSSLSAGLRLATDNEQGSGGSDTTNLSVDLNYNYALGQDWDLVSGVSFRTEQREDADDNNTGTVFVGLQKRFDWRP